MIKELFYKAKNLQYFFTKPEEMRVHIGAHKTATTHLQDTLELCESELKKSGIRYISRDRFRNELAFLAQEKVFTGQNKSALEKRYTLASKLFQFHGKGVILTVSEENIMGNILDGLSPFPYQNPKLNFINYARQVTKVKVFVSLRSFSGFYPGAYITALRFNPSEALHRKKVLLNQLNEGACPSWEEVVKRLQAGLTGCELKCWTFDDYLQDKKHVLTHFLAKKPPELPNLPKTIKTATPSTDAIQEIESVIGKKSFTVTPAWRNQCDNIFQKYTVSENNPKYTFLSETLQQKLDEQFDKDISELKKMNYFI
ncbi:hypothetical protein [Alteromonas lipotrueiana]|uniref:hypothetical protein n=1 Tax=Alteromonas lipotrueiana TaxID=2803815 RepID=UPI001C472908|nr:hypothetical protein [Alteromonas lipotrueiana]